jgi:quercetin dioxygenase-like cupin family protein
MSRPGDDAETTYVRGVDQPWIPFDPLSEHVLNERVLIRYHRIDPVEGQIVAAVRLPSGLGSAPLYHTGPVIAHTIRGAWRYREERWISRAGDTVYESAGSMHRAESIGDEETVVFLVVTGEFLFFDDEGSLIWQESWRTSMDRHAEYCRAKGVSPMGFSTQY